jgi:hypothetical protein
MQFTGNLRVSFGQIFRGQHPFGSMARAGTTIVFDRVSLNMMLSDGLLQPLDKLVSVGGKLILLHWLLAC